MNMQHSLYYELLSNYMGKGDKETLQPRLAAGQHFTLWPPGSISIARRCASTNRRTATISSLATDGGTTRWVRSQLP
jgi:hypothetical protein